MSFSQRLFNYRFGLLAALSYGLTAPIGKLLLLKISPFLLASLSYLGAGFFMLILRAFLKTDAQKNEARLQKNNIPLLGLMVILDALAPILLFLGLKYSAPSTVALLGNFEVVATSVIALVIFKEAVGVRLWVAIMFISFGGIILSVEDWEGLLFSPHALCVLCATILWGLENNITRMLSFVDPMETVVIKGLGSGTLALIFSLTMEKTQFTLSFALFALIMGAVSVGLSVYFYILSQRILGAARTSSVYAVAPFIGVTLSFIIFGDTPVPSFYLALILMLIGIYLSVSEKHSHFHTHRLQTHEHIHSHKDSHHQHPHNNETLETQEPNVHSHKHSHSENPHAHEHLPDLHHIHSHDGKIENPDKPKDKTKT
jgi:drug/metabolite transporter (DMT)-like permease